MILNAGITYCTSWNSTFYEIRSMLLGQEVVEHIMGTFKLDEDLEPSERVITPEEWEAARLLVFLISLYF
jgi:hypothetical protein